MSEGNTPCRLQKSKKHKKARKYIKKHKMVFLKVRVYIDRQGCRRVQVSHSDVGGNEGFYV